jgi:CCR4-NOT transcription complex subunit 9
LFDNSAHTRPFEYLRLTSLGVIGALVKMDDAGVINFLLQTEIIPLCLRIMETGSELSKTVKKATWFVSLLVLLFLKEKFCKTGCHVYYPKDTGRR